MYDDGFRGLPLPTYFDGTVRYSRFRPHGPFREVCFRERRFTVEDDGHGGSVDVTTDEREFWLACPGTYGDTIHESPAREAADAIRHDGLTFRNGMTGGADWASCQPYTVDYATGEECERSAHLFGFTPDEERRIQRMVDYGRQ